MTIPLLTANDLEFKPATVGAFDYSKKKADFDNGAKSMVYDLFKVDGKFFNFVFDATLASGSIICTQFDGNANFSMVVELNNDNDTIFLQKLNDIIVKQITDYDETWTPTTIVKDDSKIFLKLKYDNKKSLNLKPSTNIPINLKKPMDTKLLQGQEVQVACQLGFYINFAQKTYGASLNPTEFLFK